MKMLAVDFAKTLSNKLHEASRNRNVKILVPGKQPPNAVQQQEGV